VSNGTFENALYDVLENWVTVEGLNDPAVHKSVFPRTGSTEIIVSGDPGSKDFIQCSSIHMSNSSTYKSCTLVVSDYSAGSDPSLKKLYAEVLAGKTMIGPEIQALLNVFKSNTFLQPQDPKNGNGMIQLTHTLNTGLLHDGIEVTAYYGYVNPLLNGQGLAIADGIALILTGVQLDQDTYTIEQAKTQIYGLSAPIP
jgi:hypothetical protein